MKNFLEDLDINIFENYNNVYAKNLDKALINLNKFFELKVFTSSPLAELNLFFIYNQNFKNLLVNKYLIKSYKILFPYYIIYRGMDKDIKFLFASIFDNITRKIINRKICHKIPPVSNIFSCLEDLIEIYKEKWKCPIDTSLILWELYLITSDGDFINYVDKNRITGKRYIFLEKIEELKEDNLIEVHYKSIEKNEIEKEFYQLYDDERIEKLRIFLRFYIDQLEKVKKEEIYKKISNFHFEKLEELKVFRHKKIIVKKKEIMLEDFFGDLNK